MNKSIYLFIKNYNREINEKICKRKYSSFKASFVINPLAIRKNQQKFMDDLFLKLQLTSIEDWKNVYKKDIVENGGKKLLQFYSSDMEKLLLSIYPNYSWDFDHTMNPTRYFQSLSNQKKFMDNLYKKFELNSLDEWLSQPIKNIVKNGGQSLLKFYSNDIEKLLSSIYPTHFWQFEERKINSKFDYFSDIENQRKFMNDLFKKLNLKSMDDWVNVNRKTIQKNGGKILLKWYYKDDMQKLYSNIYPNYHFNFENLLKLNANDYFQSIENQISFMDSLFYKLNLKNLEDWLATPKIKITKNGGKSLIFYYYSKDIKKLLSTIYPNYPWQFDKLKFNTFQYFKSIENQRKFMDDLFVKLKLNSMDDWLNTPKITFINHGGKSLLKYCYANDMKKLLSSIYPEYNWNFDRLKMNVNQYFKSIENQRKFMDDLFKKLNFNSMDDWKNITRKTLLKNRGKSLLHYYSNDLQKLFYSIYPHHQWQFK